MENKMRVTTLHSVVEVNTTASSEDYLAPPVALGIMVARRKLRIVLEGINTAGPGASFKLCLATTIC
jgi:hypothetical protein